jgi:hypothetical protein
MISSDDDNPPPLPPPFNPIESESSKCFLLKREDKEKQHRYDRRGTTITYH